MNGGWKRFGFEDRELRALLISLIFLILGVFTVWISIKIFEGVKSESVAILISLLIIPALIYLVFSEKISEIFGPGGWKVKFVNTANEPISTAFRSERLKIIPTEKIDKASIEELHAKLRDIKDIQPIVLKMKLGGIYEFEVVRDYINHLSKYKNFKYIVIEDQLKHFVAFISYREMDNILEPTIQSINDNNIKFLHCSPFFVRNSIPADSANGDALRRMAEQNLDSMAVIDDSATFIYILEREQLMSNMMLTLISEPTSRAKTESAISYE